jgi:transcriptional regulator with XRE-family HTH domain
MHPFGELIRRRRAELGLSQAQLAEAAEIHPRQLRRYESDEQQPALAVAIRIAEALGASLDELAGLRTGLEGTWWAAWQLPGGAVATLPLALRRRGGTIELEALERRVWRGELLVWDDGLLTGWYDATEGRVRSRGAMVFVFRDGRAEGRWFGRSGDGPVAGGHAALAGAPAEARSAVARISGA